MKTGHVSFPCWVALAGLAVATARAEVDPEPQVADYGLGKLENYTQTGPGAPQLNENPYQFHAYVDGSATDVEVELPNDTVHQLTTGTEHHFGSAYFSPAVSSAGTLSEDFPSTAGYVLRFKTTANPTGYSVSTLGLADASFPIAVPEITGGGEWFEGLFQVNVFDPNAAIAFSPFELGGEEQGFITLEIFATNPEDYRASTWRTSSESTSIGMGPDEEDGPYFNPGDTYQGILSFYKYVDIDGAMVPNNGEQGFSFMATRTYFAFQAIPEPSTYGLMLLGLGSLALARFRRRAA